MKTFKFFITSLATTISLAASAEVVGGQCGNSLTWSYDTETTVLTIEGSGGMWNYIGTIDVNGVSHTSAPWKDYYDCITKLVASEITSITQYAFFGCSKLSSIILPVCTSIESEAFRNCSSLTSINLPVCTGIGSIAFSNCSSLTSVDLPVCTDIGSQAFNNCTSLTSINLPACTSIGSKAFSNCSSLTSIDLPNCKSVESKAFSGCSNLTIVTAPQVETLGADAFSGCASLLSINLPVCTSIGDNAFRSCSSLTSIDLPVCTSIEGDVYGGAFLGCSSLTSIDLPVCTSIGNNAFNGCSSLISIDLPECTSLGGSTFYSCLSLTTISVPKVVTVGGTAFQNCSSLTSIDLPECTSLGERAFFYCSSLATISVPKVMTVGNNAFSGCNSLMAVYTSSIEPITLGGSGVFPTTTCTILVPEESVDSYKAAQYWSDMAPRIISNTSQTDWNINVVCMPNGSGIETAIGTANLNNVVSLKINGNINAYDIFVLRNNMPNLHILDLSDANIVTTENGYKYYGNYTTTDNMLGDYAFYQQSKLLKFKLPKTITKIGSNAVGYCSNINELTIYEGVEEIGPNGFYYNVNLTTLSLPKSLIKIQESAFNNCTNLKSISMPSAQSIGSYAFFYCRSLTSIDLPSNLSNIGGTAFYNCSKLSEIILPSALKSIGGEAFGSCPITTVKATAIDPNSISIADNSFSSYGSATLYIPYDEETGWETTYLAYKWHTQWGQFTNKATWKPTYDYINVGGDYEQETGTIPGEDIDADLGNESGYVIGEDAEQDLDDTHVKHDGEGGGSIINEGDEENLNIKNLFIDIAVKGNKWYFFCFPFDIQLKDVVCDAQYIFRLYDGKERSNGKSGWKDLSQEDSYLKAGKGYIFQCDKATTLSLPVSSPKFSNSNKKTDLETFAADNSENASWNFIGNPFLSYFDMDNIDYSAPITRWNGSSYEAIRPGDDDYQFTPYEAFFVQKPQAASDVTFESAGQETKTKAKKKDAQAKARGVKRMSSNRHLINLVLSDGTNTDKTRVVFNNNAKMDYELDCDASKFMANGVAQIYSMDAKSVRYSINERPTDDGIVALGISVPEDGAFSIEAARMDTHVMLKDAETGTLYDLSDGAYTFTAKAGTYDNRFYLMTAKATGIEKVETYNEDSSETIYDLSGRKVENNAKGLNIVNGKKVYVK